MNHTPTIGDRRVSHLYARNGIRDEKHYKADTVKQAIEIINREADKQLRDDAVDWNVFTYEVLCENGWEDFEDEEYRDIDEIMRDMD